MNPTILKQQSHAGRQYDNARKGAHIHEKHTAPQLGFARLLQESSYSKYSCSEITRIVK